MSGARYWAEVPRAAGVDIYIFGGPAMRLAVQRYNLFAGGGALPPRWGLGLWYRCGSTLNQDEVLGLAREFRERRIPCDVFGLEPRWQTQTYSSSFVWNKGRSADPAAMIGKLSNDHYRLNLWEHAYTHPNSPIYDALFPFAGDYEVWGGLVPDFLQPEARRIFANFHELGSMERCPGSSGEQEDFGAYNYRQPPPPKSELLWDSLIQT